MDKYYIIDKFEFVESDEGMIHREYRSAGPLIDKTLDEKEIKNDKKVFQPMMSAEGDTSYRMTQCVADDDGDNPFLRMIANEISSSSSDDDDDSGSDSDDYCYSENDVWVLDDDMSNVTLKDISIFESDETSYKSEKCKTVAYYDTSKDVVEVVDSVDVEIKHCSLCSGVFNEIGPLSNANLRINNYPYVSDCLKAIEYKCSNDYKDIITAGMNNLLMRFNSYNFGIIAPHIDDIRDGVMQPTDFFVFNNLKVGFVNDQGDRVWCSGIMSIDNCMPNNYKPDASSLIKIPNGDYIYIVQFSDGTQVGLEWEINKWIFHGVSGALSNFYVRTGNKVYSFDHHEVIINSRKYGVLPFNLATEWECEIFFLFGNYYRCQDLDVTLLVRRDDAYTVDGKCIANGVDLADGVYRFDMKFDGEVGELFCENDSHIPDNDVSIKYKMRCSTLFDFINHNFEPRIKKSVTKNKILSLIDSCWKHEKFDLFKLRKLLLYYKVDCDYKCLHRTLLMMGVTFIYGEAYATHLVLLKSHCARIRSTKATCMCYEKYCPKKEYRFRDLKVKVLYDDVVARSIKAVKGKK